MRIMFGRLERKIGSSLLAHVSVSMPLIRLFVFASATRLGTIMVFVFVAVNAYAKLDLDVPRRQVKVAGGSENGEAVWYLLWAEGCRLWAAGCGQ